MIRDEDLPYVMTLPDMIDRDQVEAAERIDLQDARERRIGAMEASQREGNESAEGEYQSAVENAGGEPSKKAMKSGKRANREEEVAGTLLGMPISAKVFGDQPPDSPPPETQPSAAEATREPVGEATDATSTGSPRDSRLPSQPRAKNSLLRAATARLTRTEVNR